MRKVAALLDVDVGILSKMERGECRITKEVVLKLADIYDYNADDLLVSYLSDKILYENIRIIFGSWINPIGSHGKKRSTGWASLCSQNPLTPPLGRTISRSPGP